MTSKHIEKAGQSPSPISSETEDQKISTHVYDDEKGEVDNDEKHTPAKQNEFSNLEFPPPWKHERWFPGGYHQRRMLKFKNPKTMYTAINLFAGVAIMFYGYDQGVMSQVNLNPNYQSLMGIAPVEGKYVLKMVLGLCSSANPMKQATLAT